MLRRTRNVTELNKILNPENGLHLHHPKLQPISKNDVELPNEKCHKYQTQLEPAAIDF